MNWAVDPEERARRDRARIRLFTTMLATYGYAVLGASVWEPLTAGSIEARNVMWALFGVVMHVGALYIAPRGEK